MVLEDQVVEAGVTCLTKALPPWPEQCIAVILAQLGVKTAVREQLCTPQPSLFLRGVFEAVILSLSTAAYGTGGAINC